ncbi:MAG: hypothetical protein ACOYU3_09535 [Bacillota bacterium]
MKTNKIFRSLFLVFLVGVFAICPMTSFATDATDDATLPAISDEAISSNNTPPKDEISADPNYSEGFTTTRTSIAGGCSITRLDSNMVNTAGYTSCAPASPAVSVVVMLQAYYSGAWHTLQSRGRSVSGTYVNLSQAYYVTPGYYYRSYGIHQTADGTTTYSVTNGLWVN